MPHSHQRALVRKNTFVRVCIHWVLYPIFMSAWTEKYKSVRMHVGVHEALFTCFLGIFLNVYGGHIYMYITQDPPLVLHLPTSHQLPRKF